MTPRRTSGQAGDELLAKTNGSIVDYVLWRLFKNAGNYQLNVIRKGSRRFNKWIKDFSTAKKPTTRCKMKLISATGTTTSPRPEPTGWWARVTGGPNQDTWGQKSLGTSPKLSSSEWAKMNCLLLQQRPRPPGTLESLGSHTTRSNAWQLS